MKEWEKAESLVKKMTGGKATIGSGNKHEEGDVKAFGHHIEVKQTSKGTISIQYKWLKTIERNYEQNEQDGILVLFFAHMQGSCYLLDRRRKDEDYKKWASKKYTQDDLPAEIVTEKYVWVLEPLSFLRTLKEEKSYSEKKETE